MSIFVIQTAVVTLDRMEVIVLSVRTQRTRQWGLVAQTLELVHQCCRLYPPTASCVATHDPFPFELSFCLLTSDQAEATTDFSYSDLAWDKV